jgi:glycosyltransferase involved in cell wall biosynthesis
MGEAGKKRALELFTLDRMIEQYQQLYKGVIEGC